MADKQSNKTKPPKYLLHKILWPVLIFLFVLLSVHFYKLYKKGMLFFPASQETPMKENIPEPVSVKKEEASLHEDTESKAHATVDQEEVSQEVTRSLHDHHLIDRVTDEGHSWHDKEHQAMYASLMTSRKLARINFLYNILQDIRNSLKNDTHESLERLKQIQPLLTDDEKTFIPSVDETVLVPTDKLKNSFYIAYIPPSKHKVINFLNKYLHEVIKISVDDRETQLSGVPTVVTLPAMIEKMKTVTNRSTAQNNWLASAESTWLICLGLAKLQNHLMANALAILHEGTAHA